MTLFLCFAALARSRYGFRSRRNFIGRSRNRSRNIPVAGLRALSRHLTGFGLILCQFTLIFKITLALFRSAKTVGAIFLQSRTHGRPGAPARKNVFHGGAAIFAAE